jgi:hypothetical protein
MLAKRQVCASTNLRIGGAQGFVFAFLSIMLESDFLNRELCTNCCLWDSATKKKIPRFARHSFFRVKIPQTRFNHLL